jgi:hypothetical protein
MGRFKYLVLAARNVRGPVVRLALGIMAALLCAWVLGLLLLPGPHDPLVRRVSWLPALGAIVALAGAFHNILSLRQKYPPLLIVGGLLSLGSGAWCLWGEPSWGTALRVGPPLLLVGLWWYYDFWFSMLSAKQRVSRLKVGERFPDFALPDSENQVVRLGDVLARGPALLLFYKGDW